MGCLRCGQALWLDEQDLCPVCAVSVRMEFRRGLRALERYLARWAEFADWQRVHDVARR